MNSLLWSFAAWCALALAMERHHEQAFGHEGSAQARRRWCRGGVLGLVAALICPVPTDGWALGLLHGATALGAAGLLVPALFAWMPRACAPLAAAAALLGAWLTYPSLFLLLQPLGTSE